MVEHVMYFCHGVYWRIGDVKSWSFVESADAVGLRKRLLLSPLAKFDEEQHIYVRISRTFKTKCPARPARPITDTV